MSQLLLKSSAGLLDLQPNIIEQIKRIESRDIVIFFSIVYLSFSSATRLIIFEGITYFIFLKTKTL